ncbi:MAG: aldehyde ferredoxin oxidoreductase family protein [Chloroflexi bacterium]|nr:aldehyde ferredoxin oxidoreductase family protein [Chloroflexota bacterium]
MKGFFNKVLHVDLTGRTYWVEELKDKALSSWLGGRGLGCYLLWKTLKAGIDPLSPENVLIFATGPATATKMQGSSRYGVYSKSPLTNFFADSYAGGHLAPQMKKTGYDAIVVHGASSSPVFLEISSDGARFWDASDLWGNSTYETEEQCLSKVNIPGAQALVIGPAGENLVRFACIVNNRWRNAGRTGMGAIMGSKKLKAMVFHGEKKCEIADPGLLDSLVHDLTERGKNDPTVRRYRELGTPMLVATTNLAGAFPAEYWSKGTLPGWEKISAETMQRDFEVKARACTRCFIACGKLTTVTQGRHRGLTLEGPEYETIYSFGGLCKILDLAEIIYLNDICDRLGIDTITAGNIVAFCMELSKRGKLSEKVDYGNPDHAAELLHKICQREGLGDTLAEGINKASQVLGAEDLAIHVKGLEPAGYDPRVLKGMALGYGTSPRGACHLPATYYIFELRGVVNPSEIQGKAESYIGYEDRLTIMDTMILCRFFRDMIGWPESIKLIKATTGLEFDESGLRELANNITTLRHLMNIREGWSKENDMLPARLLDEPINGHRVTKDELNYMVNEYYQLRGWDEDGKPLKELSIE